MTNSSRVTSVTLLAIGVLALAATGWTQARPPIVDQIARTYGVASFSQIEGIRYTFNLDFPGRKVVDKWEWEPKTGKVSYEGKGADGKPVKVTYLHSDLSGQSDTVKNQIDPAFINDQYWLLLPLHVSWDTGAVITNNGAHKLPLGKGSAEQVVVKYPSQGGYTPGDTWELYVGKDGGIEQIIYRRGGPKKPSIVVATWAGQKKAGPLLISTDHHGTADGNPLRVFFSDVSVKLKGSDNWVSAQ